MPPLDDKIDGHARQPVERMPPAPVSAEIKTPSAQEAPAEPEDIYAETESVQAPASERRPEAPVEAAPEAPPLVETEGALSPQPSAVSPQPSAVSAPPKDPLLRDIEAAMQEDLEDLYRQLPPARQAVFRARGEQAARKIRALVAAAHAHVKKIFRLLFDWLRLIPGVNRFFLEQEAKIKTDKILAAAEEERRRGRLA